MARREAPRRAGHLRASAGHPAPDKITKTENRNQKSMDTISASEILSEYNYAVRPLDGDTNWYEFTRKLPFNCLTVNGMLLVTTKDNAAAALKWAETPQKDGAESAHVWPHEILCITE